MVHVDRLAPCLSVYQAQKLEQGTQEKKSAATGPVLTPHQPQLCCCLESGTFGMQAILSVDTLNQAFSNLGTNGRTLI